MCALCGDADVASEATDEAFSRCYVRWERVGQMGSPLGWTLRVAQNAMRRTMRRRAIERRLIRTRVPPPSALDQSFVEAEELLSRLSPRQRTAMILRYVADLPEADIAVAMSTSRGTVASTLFDARKRLAADPVVSSMKETSRDA